jgi:hypothetical protein
MGMGQPLSASPKHPQQISGFLGWWLVLVFKIFFI